MKDIFKRKLIWALIFNFIILGLEIVGLVLSVQRHGIKVFIFYTENSNYFALVISLIFCITAIIALTKNALPPQWVHILRFIATVCLTITFIVSVFVIIPFKPSLYKYMLYQGSSLYQHILCPLLSLSSFLFFEYQKPLSKKVIFYALIPTIIYGGTCVVLNLLRVMTGPYPFFYFYQIPWYISIPSLLGVVAISTLTAFMLYVSHTAEEKRYIKKHLTIEDNYLDKNYQ